MAAAWRPASMLMPVLVLQALLVFGQQLAAARAALQHEVAREQWQQGDSRVVEDSIQQRKLPCHAAVKALWYAL